MKYIIKRDGSKEPYNIGKIQNVIQKAFSRTDENSEENIQAVLTYFINHFSKLDTVEEIQDAVEKSLMAKKFFKTAKEFILYRKQRENIRNSKTSLTKTFREVLSADGSDISRENANVDGKAPMGLMLLFGSEIEKDYVKRYMISPKFTELHESGDIHIHDLNMYACTFNCCNIGLKDLLGKGFNTGHGNIREPQSIQSAMSLTAIIVQANQNDMFGGQGIPLWDYELTKYVAKSFGKRLKEVLEIYLGYDLKDNTITDYVNARYENTGTVLGNLDDVKSFISFLGKENTDKIVSKALQLTEKDVFQACEGFVHNLNTLNSRCLPKDEEVVVFNGTKPICDIGVGDSVLSLNPEIGKFEYKKVLKTFNNGIKELITVTFSSGQKIKMTPDHKVFTSEGFKEIQYAENILTNYGFAEIVSKTKSEPEEVFDIEVQDNHNFCVKDKNSDGFSVVHNCGSQVPFSSINYGTCTTEEGRLLIKSILKATEQGLGNHETPIFPVQIFKVKEGINANPGDPNYDLFKLACEVSAKRMYPNFVNIDVPGNIEYYQKGKPETEMATMGCRTKVLSRLDGSARTTNRGNIAFCTINLPRLGILAEHNIDKFFEMLDQRITDCIDELMERVKFLCTKKVCNFPFLMGQNIYLGAENLGWNDSIEPSLRNGTLAVGFIGIAEALVALTGKHHGESDECYELALKIVQKIRDRTDKATEDLGWQFGCFATPAEGLSERFVKIDKKKFGAIEGVTDRQFYTNSFHIPVYFPITATRKMQLEGRFHEICNAGAITYVEMDGDPSQNLDAFEKLVHFSRKCGISYFSINHDLDRCPICGFQGIIPTDTCPNCGWKEGTEIDLEVLKDKGLLKHL